MSDVVVSLGWIQNSLQKEVPILWDGRQFIMLKSFLKNRENDKMLVHRRGHFPAEFAGALSVFYVLKFDGQFMMTSSMFLLSHWEAKPFFPQIRRLGTKRPSIKKSKIWQNQIDLMNSIFFISKQK